MASSALAAFSATQTIELPVPEEPVPIRHYLRQPKRLVDALGHTSRIESLGDNRFRLLMRPLSLFALTFQPTVDMQLRSRPDGTVRLKSVGCEIRGIEYINRRFSLELYGQLRPVEADGQTVLRGVADLAVRVELPPPLRYMPQAAIQPAGDRLLKSVLSTIEQRIRRHLLQDYERWVADGVEAEARTGWVADGSAAG